MKIFRQNIEGKAKYFNEQGQTTLENLTFLTSPRMSDISEEYSSSAQYLSKFM